MTEALVERYRDHRWASLSLDPHGEPIGFDRGVPIAHSGHYQDIMQSHATGEA